MEEKEPIRNQKAANGAEQKKSHWDIRPYLAVGLTVILVVIVCILIFFLLFRVREVSSVLSKLLDVLQPIIFGFILAYLLNPVMMFFEGHLKKSLKKRITNPKRLKSTVRGLSIACAMAVFLVFITILSVMVVPQLIASIQDLVMTMGDKLESLMEWVRRFSESGSPFETWIAQASTEVSATLTTWLQEKFLNQDFFTAITTGVYSVVKIALNAVIGLIVAVYIMTKKERFIGQTKKLVYAVLKPKYGNFVVEVLRKSNSVFGGFFIGKIIDSIIIGFICFGCLWILRMPYVTLVSLIIGVTNVIPVFGPYIGAIPCTLLIFLVNPLQGLYFLIFIIILQQVDGNIIGPKILGDSTGLSPFWVIFAILIFGGFFGVVGMLFGVPIFAVIYYLIRRIADHFLRKQKLPLDSAEYIRIERIDPRTNQIKYKVEKKTTRPIKSYQFFRKRKK